MNVEEEEEEVVLGGAKFPQPLTKTCGSRGEADRTGGRGRPACDEAETHPPAFTGESSCD